MKKLAPIPWFWIGMLTIYLLSVGLRFWGLGRFNEFVFDEVYYVKTSNNYLTHTPFYEIGTPPLSKYFFAISMWIGDRLPFGKDMVNSLAGSPHSTWSYRWLNAFTGSFVPLVVAGIAYLLSYRRSYAFIAGLFAALDGLCLVESRYALNNIYLVLFGVLAHLMLLLALANQGRKRWAWLTLSGLFFGLAAGVKWNGVCFLAGAYLIWASARLWQWLVRRNPDTGPEDFQDQRDQGRLEPGKHLASVQQAPAEQQSPEEREAPSGRQDPVDQHEIAEEASRTASPRPRPLQNLTQIRPLPFFICLGVIPLLTYILSWFPHLYLDPVPGFFQAHREMLGYHVTVRNGPQTHPYVSMWYTWLFMLRPVAYLYHAVPTPPQPSVPTVVYDVHGMGNPALWCLCTASMLLLFWLSGQRILFDRKVFRRPPTPEMLLAAYLILNWAANLILWMKVTHYTFLYHYMEASLFAQLAVASIVDRGWCTRDTPSRAGAVGVIILVVVAFIYWLPIYLALPLSPERFQHMMWFRSWI